MSNKIVLDTHILIWSILNPENLSKIVSDQIVSAQSNNELYISAITLWEIAMLMQKKRINLYEPIRDFLEAISNINGLNIIPITPISASESVSLPGGFLSDPADCMIIAAAREIAGTLVSRDKKIIKWALQGYLKVIPA